MNSAGAIFIKQFQDILKNSGVLIQFIMFPGMAFMMTRVASVPGTPDSFFITMFAGVFIGMTLIGAVAIAIAEDRGNNSLRFLLMAGVKSHEYLLGIGGVIFVGALAVGGVFTIMMPDLSIIESLIMLASMMLGAVASILFGAIIGMASKNEQSAISISTAAGMFLGFGPMMATLSGSETLENVFGIFYTMNFVYEDFRTTDAIQRFGIILANVMVLMFIFAWVYGKQETSKKGVFIMNKKVITTLLTLALVGGAGIAAAMWYSAGFVSTDHARVTTTLIPVPAGATGILERFTLYVGQRVHEDEILGWVQNGEAMRSPVDGLVVQTNAVQNQHVSQMEPVAVIADTNGLQIEAHIKETDILSIQRGQPAIVTIDGFGNRKFAGYISEIGMATQSELDGEGMSLNFDGTFRRATRFIPIRINITDDINLGNLIGVNASVRIPLRSFSGDLQLGDDSNNENIAEVAERRNVYTTLESVVRRIYVEIGDHVTEGQILCELDTGDLLFAIAQQRAAGEAVRQSSQVINAEASLRAAEIVLADAEHNYEAVRKLHDAGAISQNDLRQSEIALQSARDSHQNARALLNAARAEISANLTSMEISLEILEKQLEDSVIKAPVSGVVTAVFASEGVPGSGLLFIIDK